MNVKERTERVFAILKRELNSGRDGVVVGASRQKYPELMAMADSGVRNALDSGIKSGELRKVSHRTLKGIGPHPAVAYTHKDNPNTKDLPDYRCEARQLATESKKTSTKKRKSPELGAKAKEIIELVENNQGIDRHALGIMMKTRGLAEGTSSYHINALKKSGHLRHEGGRRFGLIFTRDYVAPRKSEATEAIAEPIAEVAQEAETAAPAINGHVNGHSFSHTSAPQAAPVGPSIDHHLKGLAQAIADTLTAHIVQAIGENLARVMGSMGPVAIPSGAELVQQVTQAAEVAKTRKPKVVILGLNNHSAGQIVADFPGLNLDFVEKNRIGKHTADMVRNADRVIAMTDFIGHNLDVKSNDHPGFERLSGGLTRLKERLQLVATI